MEVREITFFKSAVNLTQMPCEGIPEVAFIGRSNVGKSALLNMLCRRKSLARISSVPGKTQTFNYYLVNHEIYFVDIPGYGYAKVSKRARAQWRRNIMAYLTQRDSLCVVLHLVDSRHAPTDLDKEVMLLVRETLAERLLVLTKTDKLSANRIQKSIRTAQETLSAQGADLPIVVTSAVDQRGRDELLRRIADAIPTTDRERG